jgi:Asp-tRNA(Asn)/Glu-tRNA(Gln) amidotransferase A subunit family amidase
MIDALRARQVSPDELLQAHLCQIERVNPKINAFANVAASASKPIFATSSAAQAGPLAGIPFTAKDSFDVKGHATLCGSVFRSTHRADRNAASIRRMLHAGAVFLGKTNCPEFLSNWETDNHLAGRTSNPWNLELTPGGSSGGESAAIASFCSPAGLGSDGGGSIRWPAHCTGISGLKPTPGRVSAAGHYPVISHPGGLLGVAGPMARSVDDLSLVFSALTGYDVDDPFSIPFVPPRPATDGLKVGVLDAYPLQPACRAAFDLAARLLGQQFATDRFPDFPLDRAHDCWFFFFVRLRSAAVSKLIGSREHQAHWTGLELHHMVSDQPEPSGTDVVEQLALRDRLRSAFLRQLQKFPVVLAPVASITAFPHRTRTFATEKGDIGYLDALKPLTFANLFGLPALALPMVVQDGVPAGVQLVAAPYQEEMLLSIGRQLEQARGSLPAPPIQS